MRSLEKYRLDEGGLREIPSVGDGVALDQRKYAGARPPLSRTEAPNVATPQHPGDSCEWLLSATTTLATLIAGGMALVPQKKYQDRLAACMECPHHTGVRCRLCGCFTSVKARLAREECPLAKWPV